MGLFPFPSTEPGKWGWSPRVELWVKNRNEGSKGAEWTKDGVVVRSRGCERLCAADKWGEDEEVGTRAT